MPTAPSRPLGAPRSGPGLRRLSATAKAGWSEADIAKFQNMLRTQYLPSVMHGDCENGNKELAMCEALINIGRVH